MKKNFLFMGFSKGSVTTESTGIKRYIGLAPVKVLAINPTKEELESIYNTTIESAPEYVGEKDGIKFARVDFIVKTVADKCDGIDLTTKVSFFVRNEFRFNRDKSKVQVIDKYGRTAWVTKEQAEKHEIPVYSNGPANIGSDYRPVYFGEEELTNFVKAYLNIPNVDRYVNNEWVTIKTPEDAESRFDALKKIFSGDFTEIKKISTYQPDNIVKVLFGVRTADDGKQYQTVYTQMVLKYGLKDNSKLEADLSDRKSSGAYPTTDFEVCPLKEYKVEATDFNAPVVDDFPMGTSNWFQS